MSVWKLVKLKFGNSPVHFGEVGIGLEESSDRIRSDALFSAWVSAYARLFGKNAVEELLQRFLNSPQPPVRMSSTFIYSQSDGKNEIYYLPRPLKFPINYPDNDLEFFKTYKKLTYLPIQVWHRWYQGEGFTDSDARELIAHTKKEPSDSTALNRAGTFNYNDTSKRAKHPKIAVDRVTAATNLYHTGFVQFKWEQQNNEIRSLSGLYFLLEFPEEDKPLETNLRAALNLLGEEGMGGRRASGAGRFEVEWESSLPDEWQKILNPSSEMSLHCAIGLFWDDDESVLQQLITEKCSYEIQERRGWISGSPSGRNLRRKSVQMFLEGSVFPRPPLGKLADVTPGNFTNHKIYRNGIALSLPIKVKREKISRG
ncbi:type III-A CRISPR-associated RAMP protein Csm4 [Phormidium sp. CCY1219]|uniref:type III-A CRISPR-associated RAMP protein Csm4 n=1 Tax=Phormidium sp. CCY1219 TaxID=2886104 RepID=UPI002D1F2020|nr:type III-A CRISPR-associated RAMP protein Csm4 [Phormidium sp. CCY1219]MEB3830202.1 type III-A CRISPR-associated RAMP protein Csm4 [Phormidium sp. CCY1219]